MTQFPIHVCEICGARKRKQGGWYLVAQDRWGDSLRILFWDETVTSRPDVQAFCCPAHVQQFVARWLAAAPGIEPLAALPGQKPALELTSQQEQRLQEALIGELQVSRAALHRGFATERESTLSILDAIEAVLESYGSDLQVETEEAQVYDA